MGSRIIRFALVVSLAQVAIGHCRAQVLKGSNNARTATIQKLPPNAKTRPITAQEMAKYDAEALAKVQPMAGPEAHASAAGIQAVDPAILQVLEQEKLAAPPVRAPQPVAAGRPMLMTPATGPTTLMKSAPPSTRMATMPQPNVAARPLANPHGVMPHGPKVTVACLSPQVTEVNRQPKNAVFTPEQQYNSYVIRGCFFGNQPGHAYLVGKFNALQVDLQASYWTDTEIDARVDPATSGELDQQNVALVVAPVGTAPIKTVGFRFVAARSGPVFLPRVPQGWLTHSGWVGQWAPPSLTYFSPVPQTNLPSAVLGTSVVVVRSMTKKFSPGVDYFTPQLAQGWTIASVGSLIISAPPSCPGIITYRHTFGLFSIGLTKLPPDWTHLNRSGIRVDGADTSCSGFIGPVTYADWTGSAYALKVWARGPRCTDPYTGQAQPQCIQNVRMCGNETCN